MFMFGIPPDALWLNINESDNQAQVKSFLHQETQEFSHQCLFSPDNGTMYKFCDEKNLHR